MNGWLRINRTGFPNKYCSKYRLEWVVLGASDWENYAESDERQKRMFIMNQLAHSFGIATGTMVTLFNSLGADVPIAEEQQHAWYMVPQNATTLAEQVLNIMLSFE